MDEDTFRALRPHGAPGGPTWPASPATARSPTTCCRRLLPFCAERSFASESSPQLSYRIATNLAHDRHRQTRGTVTVPVPAEHGPAALTDGHDVAADTERRTDLDRAMAQLKPRERELLWLAYAHGSSHEEIADSLGLRKASIKMLLFRARRRLAGILGAVAPKGPRS